jgi:toxin YoeB
MKYILDLTPDARKDIQILRKSGDHIALKKLESLFEELENHPYTGTGHPKLLKHKYSGCYSRKITEKHRLVYRVNDASITVIVLSTEGHYDDK